MLYQGIWIIWYPISSCIFSKVKPIYLSGHVDGNILEKVLASIVPLYIDVISNGANCQESSFMHAHMQD